MKLRIPRTTLALTAFFLREPLAPFLAFLMPWEIAHGICDGLVIATTLYAIAENPRRIRLWSIAVIAFAAASFAWTHSVHPEYDPDIFETYNIFETVFSLRKGLALMFLLSLERNPKNLLRAMPPCALLVWGAYSLRAFVGTGLGETTGANHMYGYAFLMVSIVFSLEFLRKKNLFNLFFMVIPLIQVLLYASRTAILSYGLFWVLHIIFPDTHSRHHGRNVLVAILLFALGYILSSSFFAEFVGDVADSLGVSSKIIRSYVEQNFEMDGGRAMMYENDRALLAQHPEGLGVYWDRYTYPLFHYTHSFFYELLLDYGWVLGGAILLGILLGSLLLMIRADRDWKDLFTLFFCLCAIRLCLSHSFWINTEFWGMLSILLSYHSRDKRALRVSLGVSEGGLP